MWCSIWCAFYCVVCGEWGVKFGEGLRRGVLSKSLPPAWNVPNETQDSEISMCSIPNDLVGTQAAVIKPGASWVSLRGYHAGSSPLLSWLLAFLSHWDPGINMAGCYMPASAMCSNNVFVCYSVCVYGVHANKVTLSVRASLMASQWHYLFVFGFNCHM